MSETLWKIGGASVRGAAHARQGLRNQDALAWAPAGPAPHGVGAISDGHGAPVHFRSDVGARIAVRCAVELLSWQIEDAELDESDGALAGALSEMWREHVAEHRAANPYSPAESLLPQATGTSAYGATLAAFAASPTTIVALHIGDGDLVFGYPDGRVERPLREDAGLVGEETYSLCLDDAPQRFRVATMWIEPGRASPDFLFAGSDGISKSFQDDAAFRHAVTVLRERAIADWDALMRDLPDWLQQITDRGSGDDCTACIALRAPCAPSLSDEGTTP